MGIKIWKDISFTDNNYSVSNLGNVMSKQRYVINNINGGKRLLPNVYLSPKTKKNGYLEVQLIVNNTRKMFYVHRLVAHFFIGNIPDKYEINHKDGNKSNNNIDNLAIVDRFENAQHSYHVLNNKNLINCIGEKHGMSKLNNEDIFQIREMYKNGIIPREIQKIFTKASASSIAKVCYRETWKHI